MGATDLGDEQIAPKPPDKSAGTGMPVGTAKPVGIFRAIGIAHRTTWRRPQFYVLVVGAMQVFLLLIAIPVIRLLYGLVLQKPGWAALRTTGSLMYCATRSPI